MSSHSTSPIDLGRVLRFLVGRQREQVRDGETRRRAGLAGDAELDAGRLLRGRLLRAGGDAGGCWAATATALAATASAAQRGMRRIVGEVMRRVL